MIGYAANILLNPSILTTYNTGLLQTKAYRILKSHTTELLRPYGITTIEWAFLGVLKDHKQGLRAVTIAQIIGVEQPFVTVLSNHLKKKQLVQIAPDLMINGQSVLF